MGAELKRVLNDSGFVEGGVNSAENILGLTAMNGVRIEKLEERLRPNEREGMGHGILSFDGFIGPNESLLGAMVDANEVVRSAGRSHDDLSGWLGKAMSACDKGTLLEHNGMKYSVTHEGTVSKGQRSPFVNDKLVSDPEDFGWDGEYTVVNLSTGREIRFSKPIVKWIRKWGFYEGVDTPYHVSPQRIIDVFERKDRDFLYANELGKQIWEERIGQGFEWVAAGGLDDLKAHPDIYEEVQEDLALLRVPSLSSDKVHVVEMSKISNHRITRLVEHGISSTNQVGFVIRNMSTSEVLVVDNSGRDYKIGLEEGGSVITMTYSGDSGYGVECIKRFSLSVDEDKSIHRQVGDMLSIGDYKTLFRFGRQIDCGSYDRFSYFTSKRGEVLVRDADNKGRVSTISIRDNMGMKAIVLPANSRTFSMLGMEVGDGDYAKDVCVDRFGDGCVEMTFAMASGEVQRGVFYWESE